VIPEFYNRDTSGIPTAWVKRMRESMANLTPRFSADRTVREYTEQYYLPAAAAYLQRSDNNGEFGTAIVDWRHSLEQKWPTLRFGTVTVETRDGQHFFEVQLYLNDLDPEVVRVELYAGGAAGSIPVRLEMRPVYQAKDAASCHVYAAAVADIRPSTDFTARVIPYFADVKIPLEEALILWHH
jgi:starch phosphorylase